MTSRTFFSCSVWPEPTTMSGSQAVETMSFGSTCESQGIQTNACSDKCTSMNSSPAVVEMSFCGSQGMHDDERQPSSGDDVLWQHLRKPRHSDECMFRRMHVNKQQSIRTCFSCSFSFSCSIWPEPTTTSGSHAVETMSFGCTCEPRIRTDASQCAGGKLWRQCHDTDASHAVYHMLASFLRSSFLDRLSASLVCAMMSVQLSAAHPYKLLIPTSCHI